MDQTTTPQVATSSAVTHGRQETDLGQARADGTTDQSNDSEIGSKTTPGPDTHAIFDERLRLFTEAFGDICEEQDVPLAIAIVADPKVPQRPIVFLRGDEYGVARLLAALLRQLKHDILKKITA